MQVLSRVYFFGYWIVLTIGLIHPEGGEITGWAGAGIGNYPDTVHFLAFALLAFLAWFARLGWSATILATVLIGYGAVGELVQMVIPGRTASLLDGLANVCGVGVGLGLAMVVVGRRNGRAEEGCGNEFGSGEQSTAK